MIKIENVEKSYGATNNKTIVLNKISFEVEESNIVAILGASGSGKSTLLNIISGLDRPDQGAVYYDDSNIVGLSEKELTIFRKKNVGFIFQQYYLLPNLSVYKNVKMGADLVNNKAYFDMIKAVGLEEKKMSMPYELSGGEQQRVAIARALAKKPRVLFMDEPTGALDEKTGRKILDYIFTLQEKNKFTVIMVTHNSNIAEMADKVIRLNSGCITEIYYNKKRKNAYEIGW